MFLNNLKKSAGALSTSMTPKCPKRKKNPSKTEPIFRKRSSRLSVKENLGSTKHDVIPCNFNQGDLLKKTPRLMQKLISDYKCPLCFEAGIQFIGADAIELSGTYLENIYIIRVVLL